MVKSLEEPQSEIPAAMSSLVGDMELHPAIFSLIYALFSCENGGSLREVRDFLPNQEGEGRAIYIKRLAHKAVETLLDDSLTEV